MSARYVFRSEWRLAASPDDVYAAHPVGGVLRARQTGDLDGFSQWSIDTAEGGAVVVFDEDVVVRNPLLRRAGLLARPALRLNHDLMMREGERALRRHLERR